LSDTLINALPRRRPPLIYATCCCVRYVDITPYSAAAVAALRFFFMSVTHVIATIWLRCCRAASLPQNGYYYCRRHWLLFHAIDIVSLMLIADTLVIILCLRRFEMLSLCTATMLRTPTSLPRAF